MPHGPGSGRRQEKRCWLPNGDIVYVEEGTDCPGISGQQGSGRRRLYWEEQGLITRAPQRPPARPGGPLPGDRSYTPGRGRREDDISQDYAPVVPTLWRGLITGLGLGLGLTIIHKVVKNK